MQVHGNFSQRLGGVGMDMDLASDGMFLLPDHLDDLLYRLDGADHVVDQHATDQPCPLGQHAGDFLWVQEATRSVNGDDIPSQSFQKPGVACDSAVLDGGDDDVPGLLGPEIVLQDDAVAFRGATGEGERGWFHA